MTSKESKLDLKALQANRHVSYRNYWRNRLTGFEFGTYFNGTSRTGDFLKENLIEYKFESGPESYEALDILAKSAKAKHMVLLATLGTLIYKCSSFEDIAVFTPIYKDKILPDEDGTIVPIRLSKFKEVTFSELLLNLRDNVLKDFENGRYPIEKILNIQNDQLDWQKGIGMSVNEIQDASAFLDSPMELVFSFDITNSLKLSIWYDYSKYDSDYITQICNLFFGLLGRLALNKKELIDSIELISEKEKNKILNEFNRTSQPFPEDKTIIDLFEFQVKQNPDHIAVQFENESLTFHTLDFRANQMANYLVDNAYEKGCVIGVCLERSIDLIVAIYGILKAGCVYLPLSTTYPLNRIDYITKNSQAKAIVLERERFPFFKDWDGLIDIKDISEQSSRPCNIAKPEDLAYIIYTSGSTGNPKGVQIIHRSIVNRIHWMQNKYRLERRDTILQKTPIVFDVSIWELFWWAISGSHLVLASPGVERSPEALCSLIEKEKISVIHFVPSMLSAFLSYLEDTDQYQSLISIKHLFSSGEELGTSDAILFLERCPWARLHNLYGPTEATVDVSFYEVSPVNAKNRIPIGRPIDNTQLYVLDRTLQLQPIGVPGELHIGGENLSLGYVNQPRLTREKFIKNPFNKDSKLYRTGDLARWLSDGNVEFLGRIDDQVKIRGNRIELREVEHAINLFPQVEKSIVLTKRTLTDSLQLVGYLIEEGEFVEESLREFLSTKLPDYMIPSYFIGIKEIPVNANGKVDKSALLSLAKSLNKTYVAPTSELEGKLVELWRDSIGEEKIGTDENFFRVGGDSILAVRLIGSINQKLSLHLGIPDLYENETVQKLAKFIESSKVDGSNETLELIEGELLQYDKDYRRKINDKSIEVVYPMSDIEKAMCYITQQRSEEIIYFEQVMWPVALEVLNLHVLQKALDLLVVKHDAFRKRFDLNEFAHIVHKHLKNDLIFKDLTEADEASQKRTLKSDLEKNRITNFDLEGFPLWRITIYKLRESYHEMLIEFHHSVLDGWSLASFVTELNNTYGKLLRDPSFKPASLALNYKDVIKLELYNKRSQETREYWKRELEGFKKLELKAG